MTDYTIDGQVIHTIQQGQPTRQVALLIHGWSSSSYAMSPLLPLLSQRFNCLAVDLPGYGQSPPLPERTTIAAYADILAKLIEEVSDGPVVMIGHSMGGMISMTLALRYPVLVERMVLLCPTISGRLSTRINLTISPITIMERVGLGSLLVSDRLYASFLLRLQEVVPDAAFGLASMVLSGLRAIKDAEEIELLRQAAHAADRVVAAIAGGRLVGRSENDVAREVFARLVDEGHDSAEFAIVGSGPNSASPHHEASTRVIRAGEPIVLDIGGRLGGYHSDVTRTLWVKGDADAGPDDEFGHLYDVLQRAQAAGCAAVRPDVACEQIDAAARSVIAGAGMGDQFIHRTGHGIGLEGHEDPYMVSGNEEPLAVGHAFSVEPGIYFAGRHGARIEDIAVCAESGADMLNLSPRDLYVVRGT